jgi:hypothetical protein
MLERTSDVEGRAQEIRRIPIEKERGLFVEFCVEKDSLFMTGTNHTMNE